MKFIPVETNPPSDLVGVVPLVILSDNSLSVEVLQSAVISQPPKIPHDLSFQSRTLRKLLPQLIGQPSHLLGKGLAIVFLFLSADIAARCQHKVMLPDLVQAGGFAEAGNVLIAFAPLPGMEGISDSGDVVLAEVAQHPIPHKAQVSG